MTGIEKENQIEGEQKRALRELTTDPTTGEDPPNIAPTRRSTRARKATDIQGGVALDVIDSAGQKRKRKRKKEKTMFD